MEAARGTGALGRCPGQQPCRCHVPAVGRQGGQGRGGLPVSEHLAAAREAGPTITALLPMIKRGLARWRRNEGVNARQLLFLDIAGGLAECPRQSTGDPTNRDKIYPSIRTPHLTSVPFRVFTEEVQERNL
jgi:hypothetical protein